MTVRNAEQLVQRARTEGASIPWSSEEAFGLAIGDGRAGDVDLDRLLKCLGSDILDEEIPPEILAALFGHPK